MHTILVVVFAVALCSPLGLEIVAVLLHTMTQDSSKNILPNQHMKKALTNMDLYFPYFESRLIRALQVYPIPILRLFTVL